MPRGPRNLAEGGYYHIVTRGNDRRRLFRCNQDYFLFLKIVKTYLEELKLNILHYCLMPNHVHFLVQLVKSQDLSKFMQGVLQVYANYFRKQYKSTGFVFENRYKSLLIDKESYLLECGRYIERNPLRAGLTDDLLNYPWSSFSLYAKGKNHAIINKLNPLYLALGQTDQERQERCFKYVMQERPYEHIIDEAFRIS